MEIKSNTHHLILGQLKDFLTDSVVADTLDERYRQKIAKNLVLIGGFKKTDIVSNINIQVVAGSKKAVVKTDFLIKHQEKIVVLIKFAPGSLVTRRSPNIGLSRIIKSYQIPMVISYNGEDAEILDGESGEIISVGLDNLPVKKQIEKDMLTFSFKSIETKMFEQASRIVYAFEIDGACPC
ncbi:type I restriction enzyme HsdR N-terminal domain-containing protein [bacterium]|nr:type I restriction enzyme HsdR N-terminal domain-containing protein [bacterium]